MKEKVLSREFYDRKASVVAKDLLGKILVRNQGGKKYYGRIVETEAYLGKDDLAAHSSKGRTKRTEVMFGPSGKLYVYKMMRHHCVNIVTEPENSPGCVLIRALEPLNYHEDLAKNRKKPAVYKIRDLCRGPGRLCEAFDINLSHNGMEILSDNSQVYIIEPLKKEDFEVTVTTRIGIKKDAHLMQRYLIKGSEFVSGSRKFNKDRHP